MSLFEEGYKLCYRQMVAQLHINVYLSQLFPLFLSFPCTCYQVIFLEVVR